MMLRAGVWAFIGKLGLQLIQLVVLMILARILSSSAFGVMATILVILGISQATVQFGIGSALIQTDKLTPQLMRAAQTLTLAIAIALCIGLYSSMAWLAELLKVPEMIDVMPLILLNILISASTISSQSLLVREMRFKLIAAIELLSYTIAYGFIAIPLAIAGYSYWALVIAVLSQTAIKGIAVLIFRPVWPMLTLHRAELLLLLNYGGGVFLAQLMSEIAKRSDNLVVTTMLGTSQLGYYSRAYTLMDIANTSFGTVFRDVLFSGFSKQRRQAWGDEVVEKNQSFLLAHAFAAFLILPISALVFLMSEEIVYVILGQQWWPSVAVLQVLAVGMYFRLAYKVSHAFNLAEGVVYKTAAFSLLYATLVTLGAYVGSFYGLEGVAGGVLIALTVQYVALTGMALGYLDISWGKLLVSVLPFFLSAAMAMLLSMPLSHGTRLSQWNVLPSLLVVSIIYVVFYLVALFIFRQTGLVAVMFNLMKTEYDLWKGRRK